MTECKTFVNDSNLKQVNGKLVKEFLWQQAVTHTRMNGRTGQEPASVAYKIGRKDFQFWLWHKSNHITERRQQQQNEISS